MINFAPAVDLKTCGCGSGALQPALPLLPLPLTPPPSPPSTSAVGGPVPATPTTSPALPPGERINESLYTSTDYTGNPANPVPYPLGPTPEFLSWRNQQWKQFNGWRFWADHKNYKLQALADENEITAWLLVRELSDIEVLWILGNLIKTPRTNMTLEDQYGMVSDTPAARRTVLIIRLADVFTESRTSLRDFLRIALQGAQPISEANATAEITASLGARTPAIDRTTWKNQWRQEGNKWLEQRQAFRWPAVSEILAGLPTRLSNSRPGYKSSGMSIDTKSAYFHHFGTAPGWPVQRQDSVGTWELDIGNVASVGDLTRFGYDTNTDVQKPWALTTVPGAVMPSKFLTWYAWEGWRIEMLTANRVASYAAILKLGDTHLNQLAGDAGVKPETSKKDRIVFLSEFMATTAAEQNQSIMVNAAREAAAKGHAVESTLKFLLGKAGVIGSAGYGRANARRRVRRPAGSGASFFEKLGNSFKKLIRHPAKWLQSLGEEAGKFLETISKEVARWGRIPILGEFVLNASLFNFVLKDVFAYVGAVLQDHQVPPGAGDKLLNGLANHWTALGRACAIAAPFTPPPINLVLGAAAVVFTAAGMTLKVVANRSETEAAYDQYNEDQEAAFQAEVARLQLEQEQAAARDQAVLEEAQRIAQTTLEKGLAERGLLSTALLSASGQPVSMPGGGINKFALAASVVGVIGLLGLVVWGSTR